MLEKDELVKLIISAVISSTFLNGVVTHILYSRKLKKEQKVKAENSIGEKIAGALSDVNSLVSQSQKIEIYNAEDEMKRENFSAFGGNVIYPEFMNDGQSLIDFASDISECRSKCEPYLDCGTALNLVFIDRYISQLMMYIRRFGDERLIPVLGTIFIIDIQKWQRRCNKRVIRKINNRKYKLEYQQGCKWKTMRKCFLIYRWEDTILYALLNNKVKLRKRKHFKFIKEYIRQIEESPEQFIAGEKVTIEKDTIEVVSAFAEACEVKKVNQEEQLMKLMKGFIKQANDEKDI